MYIDSDILGVTFSLPVFLAALAAFRKPNVIPTTLEGAKLAIANISEWGKWMAGIQTAGIAALSYLIAGDHGFKQPTLCMTTFQRYAALIGFVYSGAALFFTAWVLSALPSLAIRIHSHPEEKSNGRDAVFDIYEQSFFAAPGLAGWPHLAYLLMVKHWLWAIGLIGIGCYTLTVFVNQPSDCTEKPPGAAISSIDIR